MTDILRKRAERQRRREAGEVRVEVWLAPDEAGWVKRISYEGGLTISETVRWSVRMMMENGK